MLFVKHKIISHLVAVLMAILVIHIQIATNLHEIVRLKHKFSEANA